MDINYDALRFYWEILITVALLGNYVFQYVLIRGKVNRQAINRVDEKVVSIEKRVIVVEQKIMSMPNEQTISDLYNSINNLNREIGGLEHKLTATNNLLNTLHQHELSKS